MKYIQVCRERDQKERHKNEIPAIWSQGGIVKPPSCAGLLLVGVQSGLLLYDANHRAGWICPAQPGSSPVQDCLRGIWHYQLQHPPLSYLNHVCLFVPLQQFCKALVVHKNLLHFTLLCGWLCTQY